MRSPFLFTGEGQAASKEVKAYSPLTRLLLEQK